jgi:RNA polymerase sigma factor (sigma-70 family)
MDIDRECIDELIELQDMIYSAVSKVDFGSRHGYWDREDLVQEAYLRVLIKIEDFKGDSKLKTWVYRIARNRALDMARRAKLNSETISREIPEESLFSRELRSSKRMEFTEGIKALMRWLKQNPEQIENGWEVMTLMLKNGGNSRFVASAMTKHTGHKWSTRSVNNVVKKVKASRLGSELCGMI